MSDEQRPELTAVLDHYDVAWTAGRVAQMTHCPLHEDRTPSLSLHLERQVWRCHSCGRGGDSYQLLMDMEGISFVRARALAATLGLTTRDPGGNDEAVSGSRYGGRRTLPARPRDRPRHSTYVPAWRRR